MTYTPLISKSREPLLRDYDIISPDNPPTQHSTSAMPIALRIEHESFVDSEGRHVFLRGVNFTSDSKFPAKNSHRYVNSPCTLDEVDEHLDRIKNIGFNTLRYLFTWDALQPDHPDEFDEEYIDFTIQMLRKAVDRQLYVVLDPHQDIWSRFSGGSGAPLWTLHAAGFNPDYFDETHAAMIWSVTKKKQIKMQWASNYFRLVCQTMWTLFFAGEVYAPKTEINGVNLGTYLKNKYFSAVAYFMQRVRDAHLGEYILGFESLNEPSGGLIGWGDLGELSSSTTAVKLGTAPTPIQGMLLGQGIAQRCTTYKFTGFGIKKVKDRVLVAPKHSCWYGQEELAELDTRYGWQRSWPGGCIWELHGIYDSKTQKLLLPKYFSTNFKKQENFHLIPEGIQTADLHEYLFVNKYFLDHWVQYRDLVRTINPDWMRFMQAPVNAPPPDCLRYNKDAVDNKCVYTPHFYDGLTLMLKKWRFLNVDAIGVMRSLYSSPIRALRFGDKYISLSFAKQFEYMHIEQRERLGRIPMLMTEIGIPYDMHKKSSYESGVYTDQIRAMNANITALEMSDTNFCIWCYCIHNSHKAGDGFAGEDLSIYSPDDKDPALDGAYDNGIRAAEAVIRPCAQAIAGRVTSSAFDMQHARFELKIIPTSTKPSIVFVPQYYFPYLSAKNLRVSSGHVTIRDQRLEWRTDVVNTEQTLEITGRVRFKKHTNMFMELIEEILRCWIGRASDILERPHLRLPTSETRLLDDDELEESSNEAPVEMKLVNPIISVADHSPEAGAKKNGKLDPSNASFVSAQSSLASHRLPRLHLSRTLTNTLSRTLSRTKSEEEEEEEEPVLNAIDSDRQELNASKISPNLIDQIQHRFALDKNTETSSE